MNITLDKVKDKVKFNKKIILFLMILTVIALISGSIFLTILNEEDFKLVSNHLNGFLDTIKNNKMNYLLVLKNNLIPNIIYVFLIWFLGISIIGIPIIIFIYFFKVFILGFSVASIMATYSFKGILFSLIYIFPGQIFTMIGFLILSIFALNFSFKILNGIFFKKVINFKFIITKYLIILGLCLGIIVLFGLYDTYLMPNIIKLIINFIR